MKKAVCIFAISTIMFACASQNKQPVKQSNQPINQTVQQSRRQIQSDNRIFEVKGNTFYTKTFNGIQLRTDIEQVLTILDKYPTLYELLYNYNILMPKSNFNNFRELKGNQALGEIDIVYNNLPPLPFNIIYFFYYEELKPENKLKYKKNIASHIFTSPNRYEYHIIVDKNVYTDYLAFLNEVLNDKTFLAERRKLLLGQNQIALTQPTKQPVQQSNQPVQQSNQPVQQSNQPVQQSNRTNLEFEKSIIESLAGKKIIIWEKDIYFKNLDIKKYYELEKLENIVLTSRYNRIKADFIFIRGDEKKTINRIFYYRNISQYDPGEVDEGMKVGNYGFNPYLYIKTGRLESGNAVWGSYYNFYYGKSIWAPFFQSLNLDVPAHETIFLIMDDTLINAWNVFTGKEKNNIRSQWELVDLLTIPPVVRPREIQVGEKVVLYWDDCIILETKEENGKNTYLICIKDKTNETLYKRFLLETKRVQRGNRLTREILYAQYIGNDREGRMRFREVEN